jgi:hypothetical protein
VIPGFAFAWLELVSHSSFFPSLLLFDGQKGFSVVHQLLVDMLLFLEPHLRNIALSPAIKKLYEGTLRHLACRSSSSSRLPIVPLWVPSFALQGDSGKLRPAS